LVKFGDYICALVKLGDLYTWWNLVDIWRCEGVLFIFLCLYTWCLIMMLSSLWLI